MKFIGKNRKNKHLARARNDTSSQKVISYYTASRRQLDNFERHKSQTGGATTISGRLRSLGAKWFQIVAVLVVAGCSVYLASLNTQPHVSIEGVQYRTMAEYSSAVAAVYGNDIRNRIKPLLMTHRIEEAISKAIPEASNVTVSSGFLGHQADVKIVSDPPLLVFTQNNAPSLVMSSHGRLLLSTTASTKQQLTNLPILQNQTGVEARAGEQFMRPDEALALSRLIGQYAAENSKPIFSLTKNPHELLAKETGRGNYYARYILDDSIVLQFGALRATEKKLQDIAQQATEYIDVRLADKAYYK